MSQNVDMEEKKENGSNFPELWVSIEKEDETWDFVKFTKEQRKDGMYNFIGTGGQILSKEDFLDIRDFESGYAAVQRKNEKWNFIGLFGKILSEKEDFLDVSNFKGEFSVVKREDGKLYFLGIDGKIVIDNKILNKFSNFIRNIFKVSKK